MATRVLDAELNLAPVYVSGEEVAKDAGKLKELRISHVINATTHVPDAFPDQCKYLRIPVLDIPMPVHNNEMKAVFPGEKINSNNYCANRYLVYGAARLNF